MFKAYGLYSHIQANRAKSLFLLACFVLLLQALLYSFSLIFEALAGRGRDVPEMIANAFASMSALWPIGMIAAALWFAVAWFAHQGLIALATGSQELDQSDAPELYSALEELCISRGLTVPRLRIIETPALNAFASGIRPGNYTIAVTRGLMDTLDKREMQAVLGHELTHIRNKDVQLLVVATIFAGMFAFFGDIAFRGLDFHHGYGPRSPSSSRSRDDDGKSGAAVIIVMIIALAIIAVSWGISLLLRLAISRAREFMADAGSVELTKDPDAMISALRKIGGHAAISDMPSRMHAFFIETPKLSGVPALFATHPPMEARIAALVAHAGGRDY